MISALPARQGEVVLRDGRRLAYAEFGDLDGRPVVLLHGNPGSRLVCPDVEATASAGVRLITFDRPGFGGSDPFPLHTLTDVADDLKELSTELGLASFPVIGWSGGGPFALATSVAHPDLVSEVVVVSGSGLADDPEVLAQRTDDGRDAIRNLRAGSADALDALAALAARFAFYADKPDTVVDMTLENEQNPDRSIMQQPVVRAALTQMWEEGARQGSAGLAAGWAALWALPWGFDPADVTRPVTIWHGTRDVVVGAGQAKRLAAVIPGADLRLIDGEGHLLALAHWTEILAPTL